MGKKFGSLQVSFTKKKKRLLKLALPLLNLPAPFYHRSLATFPIVLGLLVSANMDLKMIQVRANGIMVNLASPLTIIDFSSAGHVNF